MRIETKHRIRLAQQAEKVAAEIGTTPQESVRLLFAQLVKRRRIPFPLDADAVPDNLVDIERRNRIWRELDGPPTNLAPLSDKILAASFAKMSAEEIEQDAQLGRASLKAQKAGR